MQPPEVKLRLRVKSNSRRQLHVNEEQLIKGCIRRDRIAQKYFYDTFSPKMYPLCCRYVKDPDDAEDVLVTSFTHILERIGQYRGEGSFEGWIKRAVINEALTEESLYGMDADRMIHKSAVTAAFTRVITYASVYSRHWIFLNQFLPGFFVVASLS